MESNIVYSFVRRLGQWHLYGPASRGKTFCGSPMLSNNYAADIPEDKRNKCKICFEFVDDETIQLEG